MAVIIWIFYNPKFPYLLACFPLYMFTPIVKSIINNCLIEWNGMIGANSIKAVHVLGKTDWQNTFFNTQDFSCHFEGNLLFIFEILTITLELGLPWWSWPDVSNVILTSSYNKVTSLSIHPCSKNRICQGKSEQFIINLWATGTRHRPVRLTIQIH